MLQNLIIVLLGYLKITYLLFQGLFSLSIFYIIVSMFTKDKYWGLKLAYKFYDIFIKFD